MTGDPSRWMATTVAPVRWRMSISPSVQLPADTTASISSEGLLGGKFVKLEPGRAQARLPAGGTLVRTKDFKSIEEMVGELIFLATADNQSPQAAPAGPLVPGDTPPPGSEKR